MQTASHSSNHSQWSDKRVLVTGATGTVGRELIRQIVALGVAELVGIDNNESALFFMQNEYSSRANVRLYLGDVRDRDTLIKRMNGVDIVLHTAGLKHVHLCEVSPTDAVATNILGVQNVIEAATTAHVGRVIFTSSDKAVNPTNVMGTSKLMGERLMTAASIYRSPGYPIFASTRFGNVLGSRGSVIPVFRQQIERGGPLTLTDRNMTRFIMTLAEAARLVMDSVFLAQGGEVFVTKMPVARIEDLAVAMVEQLASSYGHQPNAVEVKVVGRRPGEKMYEELLNDEELRRTIELDSYYVVLPAFIPRESFKYDQAARFSVERPYNSSHVNPMGLAELRRYLKEKVLLEVEELDRCAY